MRWYAHHNTAPVFRIYKRCRKYQYACIVYWVCNVFSDKLNSCYFFYDAYSLVSKSEFFIRVSAHDPLFACFIRIDHFYLHVCNFRVYPQVCYSKNGFGAKCCTRQDNTATFELELDERVINDCCVLTFQNVMVFHWIIIIGTPSHRMRPFNHTAKFAQ
ncbi:MAG: hypothetical protein DIAAKJNI_00567 [Candidatus Argoarchaeum ethanivorans]|uniref:Uncharacterized protein n=1 Tax=Candidatus Argoarchaeum ethanivorans TaxID=2608793 RepID=A0A811TDN5_9EURY|nr:MAG: hypothetical protein DIAAKJNI_00567 [Candidatus Argoarchaeum ethanivorans]